jgi:hypothetical protein
MGTDHVTARAPEDGSVHRPNRRDSAVQRERSQTTPATTAAEPVTPLDGV